MNQRILFNGDERTLYTALKKRAEGRGMGATEISLVRAFDRAQQHGDTLVVKPFNSTPPQDEPRSRKNNISVEDIEGLQQKINDAVNTAIMDGDGSGGGTTTTYPFDITIDPGSGNCTFIYGTMNGIAPTNIGNTLSVSMTGTRYVYLACSAVNGVFTSSTITIGSSSPTPIGTNIAYPPNSFSVLIHVVVNGTAFRVINRTSLQALSKEAFRVQKSMFTPDTLPYDSYYTWSVSDV